MLRYYNSGLAVVLVTPRRMRDQEYSLVCLQNKTDALRAQHQPCEVAFQCLRQFCGISMLVKRRCFVCHKPGAESYGCQFAFFCSEECSERGGDWHRKLCKLSKASNITIDAECVQLF